MRLEPVYLVAPEPKPPSMPSRRAFILAGAMFATGLGLGGACGYAVGSHRGEELPGGSDPEELKPSGDADLDELRHWAVKSPIDELIEHRLVFCEQVMNTYKQDKILWRGMARLCDATIGGANIPNKRMFAGWMAQIITNADPHFSKPVRHHVARLRQVK